MNTILSLRLVVAHDNDVDLSYLTQYENATSAEEREYNERDKERIAAYNNGNWWCVGIQAVAQIAIPTGDNTSTLQLIKSGGLWGIESDSEKEYMETTAKDEADELKKLLVALNVDVNGYEELVDEALSNLSY